MSTRSRPRDIETIFDDGLWPHKGGLNMPDPDESIRHKAIYEVLTTIPEADYQKLKKLAGSFAWFIPDYYCNGVVHPFGAANPVRENRMRFIKVLYLSPTLERLSFSAGMRLQRTNLRTSFYGIMFLPAKPMMLKKKKLGLWRRSGASKTK